MRAASASFEAAGTSRSIDAGARRGEQWRHRNKNDSAARKAVPAMTVIFRRQRRAGACGRAPACA
jgi:hypothetical protein